MTPICTKSFVGWGFAPDPTGRAYSAPPDHLAILGGLLLKGGEREKRKVRGAEGRVGEWREGSSSFALGRKKVSAHEYKCCNTHLRLYDNTAGYELFS